MVKVFIEKKNKTVNVNSNNVKDLLDKLKINPETVLIVKNGELTTIDARIKDKDNIRLLSVVSGG